jgi:hypothetical protein
MPNSEKYGMATLVTFYRCILLSVVVTLASLRGVRNTQRSATVAAIT